MFASAPHVFVTGDTSVPGQTVLEVSANNVTAEGCNVWIYRTNTTSTGVWWMAIGS